MSRVDDREQLRDEAATYIREMVISGQSRPGTLLRLGPIADTLDMSLTPVREALLLLTQSGWVVQEPNRGFRVARLNRRDVLDTYYVNRTIAGELAARASLLISDESIEALRSLDDRIATTRVDEQAESATRWNTELHRRIYLAADAPRLMFFVDSASLFVPRHFWASIPGWSEHNKRGHTRIIDALEIHDPDLSRQTMESHIADAGLLLVRFLDDSGTFSEADDENDHEADRVVTEPARSVSG